MKRIKLDVWLIHILGHCWPNNTQHPTPFHLGNPSRYMLTKMLSYYTLEKKNLCGLMIDTYTIQLSTPFNR